MLSNALIMIPASESLAMLVVMLLCYRGHYHVVNYAMKKSL